MSVILYLADGKTVNIVSEEGAYNKITYDCFFKIRMTIEGPLTNIAKPAIVELLRLFDENQWVVPRIRYASVRSKPELIEDIQRHFRASIREGMVHLSPNHCKLRSLERVPPIWFDLARRRWFVRGEQLPPVRVRKELLGFRIWRKRCTLRFPDWPSRQKEPGDAAAFPEPGTGAPPNSPEPSAPSVLAG